MRSNSSPLVSIIIPCFNAEKFIGDAIRSALDQTYANKEVIVIDDGSTDGSVAVVQTFGDAVQLIAGPNGGAAEARNKGLAIARGEMVQFLDADDLLHSDKLSKMVPLLLENEMSLVFCGAEVIEMETGELLGTWGRQFSADADPIVYLFGAVLQTAAPLHWRRNLLAIDGFRREMPPCDDPDLHLRLAEYGIRFRQLRENLYTSRRVEGSLSRANRERCLRQEIRLASDALERLQHLGRLTEERSKAIAGFVAGTARRALRIGMDEESQELFQRARSIHPSGGIPLVYSYPARILYRLCGPRVTEQLVGMKRRTLSQADCT